MNTKLFIILLVLSTGAAAHDCPEWLEYEAPPPEDVLDGKDPDLVAEANRRGLFNTWTTIPTDGIISVYRYGKDGKAFIFKCHEGNEGRYCHHYEILPDYYESIRDALICKDAQNAK